MSRIHCIFFALVAVPLALACRPEAQATYPDRRGGRGESCLVTNDCKEPLLCLGGRCYDETLALEPTGKVCAAGQCLTGKDCCPPLSRPEQERCKELEAECRADELFCSVYEAQCKCSATCKDNACERKAPMSSECTKSSECFGSDLCRNGRCVECSKDSECGAGHVCESNYCRLGCQHDEQCGPLEACEKLRCVDRDCESDRECMLVLGARDAKCGKDGECGLPCKNDAACAYFGGPFAVAGCTDGFCRLLGCEENGECQGEVPGGVALCVSREKAERLRALPEAF